MFWIIYIAVFGSLLIGTYFCSRLVYKSLIVWPITSELKTIKKELSRRASDLYPGSTVEVNMSTIEPGEHNDAFEKTNVDAVIYTADGNTIAWKATLAKQNGQWRVISESSDTVEDGRDI